MIPPRGVWHKPAARSAVKFIFLTPGQTLHAQKSGPGDWLSVDAAS